MVGPGVRISPVNIYTLLTLRVIILAFAFRRNAMKQSSRPAFVYPSVSAVALYYAILGYLIPAIRARFAISLAEAGLFSTMQSAGLLVSLLVCFSICSALNKSRVMAVSLMGLSLCLAGLAVAPKAWVLCAVFFFTGIFANTVDTLSNAVVTDLAPEAKSRHIGLLQAIFSAVSAGAPYFALMLGGDYATVFFGLCAFALASMATFYFGLRREMRRPMLLCPQGFGTPKKIVRLFMIRGVTSVVILSFLTMFVQVSLAYFLSSYVAEISGKAGMDAFALCMLYAGALIGRLVFVRISRRVDPYRMMAVYNALALAGIAAMLLTKDITTLGLLVLIPGFGLSANFPALVVEACAIVPDDTAAASSLVFFGVNIASFAAPPIVGLAGDAAGLGPAFLMVAAILVPVIVMSALLSRHRARSSACEQAAQV